jgi:hypothetical protein
MKCNKAPAFRVSAAEAGAFMLMKYFISDETFRQFPAQKYSALSLL